MRRLRVGMVPMSVSGVGEMGTRTVVGTLVLPSETITVNEAGVRSAGRAASTRWDAVGV